MEEPKIIDSPLSRVVEEDGVSVEVCIYRLEYTEWSLEVVAENGTSTVWDDLFATDEAALAEALRAIKEDDMKKFLRRRPATQDGSLAHTKHQRSPSGSEPFDHPIIS